MKYSTIPALAAVILAVPALASHATSLDNDGCWDARDRYGNGCISATSNWRGDRFTVTHRNNCAFRVYAKFCNQRSGGSYHDCGATGIRGYGEHKWTTSSKATGRYRWRAVGSDNSSADWVCAGKNSRWHDNLF